LNRNRLALKLGHYPLSQDLNESDLRTLSFGSLVFNPHPALKEAVVGGACGRIS
jgi:hypothetical protein